MVSETRVANKAFIGHRKAFNNLRSADQRSIVAAYRYGQIVDALHSSGYSYEDLGEDVDRSKYTVALYAALYNKYPDEHALLHTAEAMRTYNVATLAGRNPARPIEYVFHCSSCGSFDIVKERKEDEPVYS
jgi:hypothetical protein